MVINNEVTVQWVDNFKGILCVKHDNGITSIIHRKHISKSNNYSIRSLKPGQNIYLMCYDDWDII